MSIFKQCLDAEDQIAVEATGNTRFFYTQIVPVVAKCVVVNPSQFEIIKQSFKKTDKNDAEALAPCVSIGAMIKAVRHTVGAQEIQAGQGSDGIGVVEEIASSD